MELQQAVNNVVLAVRDFKGTAQHHEDLALSLKVIATALTAGIAAAAPVPAEPVPVPE